MTGLTPSPSSAPQPALRSCVAGAMIGAMLAGAVACGRPANLGFSLCVLGEQGLLHVELTSGTGLARPSGVAEGVAHGV